MHQNQSGMYTTNNLSSHAALLLSASPTIISSPLQNNTNNSQTSPISSSIAPIRRQPSTPLLAASNLDNDTHINTASPSNNIATEGYINFKKPQNEMFKKLDGKIQKIVAAHSNLNKLYALNDFSSLGYGPKRPFELPPQLPPPPPWVPKVAGEFGNQWNDEANSPLNTLNETSNVGMVRSSSSISASSSTMSASSKHDRQSTMNVPKAPRLTLDSAISKLHQRRQQQQVGHKTSQPSDQLNRGPTPSSSTSSNLSNPPTITSAQFSLLAQKIKETLETGSASKTQNRSLSNDEKRKFQEDLISMLKKEITAVTKAAKLKFSPPASTNLKSNEQKTSLLKSSPQTLFNAIRRETSLLLNKRDTFSRSSLSLLSDKQTFNRQNARENLYIDRQSVNKLQQTIKVIVPPTEFYQCTKAGSTGASKIVNVKSKKAKRFQYLGLKLSNYLERECPQPTTETITIEQFAKCLNLVRSNDASLQRHQEQLTRAEPKWRMPVGNRPLRLRRIRGERIHMPASASYRATRKVGLQ